MTDPNLNALWCRIITEELVRSGVAHVVVCPGSRNSPLLFALSAAFGQRLTVAIDERGAAFLALGMAKALGMPVAVCVTSGTAVANLLPATCEARAAGVPLVLITADRPWEAHGCGAPQTMNQRGIFGSFATMVEIGEPLADDLVLRQLRARISRVVQLADSPVHLNVPLRDPLPPLSDPLWVQPPLSVEALHGRETAFVRIDMRESSNGISPAAAFLRPGLRGIIVAGPDAAVHRHLVAALAQASGFPVVADAPSCLRRPAVAGCIGSFDAVVGSGLADEQAELVIRIGGPPLARTAYEWLSRQTCPQIVLGGAIDGDFLATAAVQWPHPTAVLCAEIGRRCASADPAWVMRWKVFEAHAQEQRSHTALSQGWSEPAAYATMCAHRGFPLLWVASSMPVRHTNLHLAPTDEPQLVLSNRGVNGIDGTIASFFGAANALGSKGLCLVGDLAFLHDLNSLALVGAAEGAIVVINNGGGAMFDALPVADVADYRRLVRADHDFEFAHAAAQFRLPYRRCTSLDELTSALDEAATGESMLVIECVLTGRDMIADHRAVLAAMR